MKVIIRKILWIIIAICVLCFAGYQAVRMYIEQKLDLVKTATAAHDITPRTKIKAEDIVMAEVPAAYLLSGTFTKASDLIGLYTDIRSYIPAGSPFYTSMLKEEKDLPDQPSLQLQEGQAVYTMNGAYSDLSVLSAGQRVDLYVNLKKSDGTPLSGCLLEHVRIISLQDHQGKNMDDADSGTPYLVSFAVNQNDIDLLTMAETAGEIRIFSTADSSYSEAEGKLKEDSQAVQYLRSMMEQNQVEILE